MPLKPYDHTTYPTTGSAGSSAAMRAELQLIEQGFDTLALELETAITGASGSATLASTKATEASASATAAQNSATNAATSAASALTNKNLTDVASATAVSAASNATNAFQSFDVRYLGAKTTAPTVNNTGGALIAGAMYYDTTLSVFRGYTGSTWINLPATTAGSISYAAAGGLTSNNVQAAITELATTKVGYSGSNLLSGRLVVGTSDPNNFGRLGTTNPTLGGVFAIATNTNTIAIMQATTNKVLLGSDSNHTVSLRVNSQDVVDITRTQYTFNNLNVGIGSANAGAIGQLGNIGASERTVFSQHTAGATAILRASATFAAFGTTTNHTVHLAANNVSYVVLDAPTGQVFLTMPTIALAPVTVRMPLNSTMGPESVNWPAHGGLVVESSPSRSGEGPASIALHRRNSFMGFLGLDTDNVLKWGGGSLGSSLHTILHTGNSSQIIKTTPSAPWVPTTGEHLVQNHGLGFTPSSCRLIYECLVADADFLPGERVVALANWNGSSVLPIDNMYVNSTVCGMRRPAGSSPYIRTKAGVNHIPTANRWRYYFEVTL